MERGALYGKHKLIVDQRWELPTGQQSKSYESTLTGCCYKKLGLLRMNCLFDKDKFVVGETANMLAEIDNSRSQANVTSVFCRLIQVTTIRS